MNLELLRVCCEVFRRKKIYRKKYITQTMWTLYMLLQTAVITLNLKVYAWMFGDQDNSDNKKITIIN